MMENHGTIYPAGIHSRCAPEDLTTVAGRAGVAKAKKKRLRPCRKGLARVKTGYQLWAQRVVNTGFTPGNEQLDPGGNFLMADNYG